MSRPMSRPMLLVAAVAIAAFVGPALAQTPVRVAPDIAFPKQDALVRVQTSISFFLPGSTGEGDEGTKLRERARRIVYDMAGRECDLAREILARECRLDSVNSNISVQRSSGNQQQEGYTVNGSMSLQVTLK